MAKAQNLNSRIQIEHDKYRDESGREGADSQNWCEHFVHDFRIAPEKYGESIDGMLDELLTAKARTVWRKKAETLPLFEINGIELPDEIIVPDKTKPTGFAKISHKHYTCGQYRESAIYRLQKAAHGVTKANSDMEIATEIIRRAEGDPNRRAIDVAD